MENSEGRQGKEIEKKILIVPGLVMVCFGPSFNDYDRLTDENGEELEWIKTEVNEGALWFGGIGDGWVPTKLGQKKGEPRVFYGAGRRLISSVSQEEKELVWQRARKREAKKGGVAGEAAARLLDLHKRAKKGE